MCTYSDLLPIHTVVGYFESTERINATSRRLQFAPNCNFLSITAPKYGAFSDNNNKQLSCGNPTKWLWVRRHYPEACVVGNIVARRAFYYFCSMSSAINVLEHSPSGSPGHTWNLVCTMRLTTVGLWTGRPRGNAAKVTRFIDAELKRNSKAQTYVCARID